MHMSREKAAKFKQTDSSFEQHKIAKTDQESSQDSLTSLFLFVV